MSVVKRATSTGSTADEAPRLAAFGENALQTDSRHCCLVC
jgi:hypothetical protein